MIQGADWPVPTVSWAEENYTNLCINSCWELYGAVDRAHFPSSGSKYVMTIQKGARQEYPWVAQWDEDEGAASSCASSHIKEEHNATTQQVFWDIAL